MVDTALLDLRSGSRFAQHALRQQCVEKQAIRHSRNSRWQYHRRWLEYLINLLHDRFKVAVLSRGYKRKTKGFLMATHRTTMQEIGDEPYQMLQKFPDVKVIVDADRCHAIDMIMTMPETKDIEVVLLDDAYQHRYVKPGKNILLVDYHRIITDDVLLPAGRLREPVSGKNRADIVIVTKCPRKLNPMEYRVLQRNLNLFPFQELFFSVIQYLPLAPIFVEAMAIRQPDFNLPVTDDTAKLPHVLLLTGIASPKQLVEDLTPYCKGITPLQFGDHHGFTASDAEAINFAYKMMEKPAIVVTTEKDAIRLVGLQGLSKSVRENLYYLPIKIKFMLDNEEKFNKSIINYVQENPRNSKMAQGANALSATNGNNPGYGIGNSGRGYKPLY